MNYRAPVWLPGGNLQTIWPALYARRVRGAPVDFRRERWTAPDGDFIDVDWLNAPGPEGMAPSNRPLMVLFHGLEGSSSSHYAQAFASFCRAQDVAFAVAHFRGCSGELNHAPRAYHSGDFQEIDWILRRFAQQHGGRLAAIGVSLGGNALMRWAGEAGESARAVAQALAAVCSPLDLAAGGHAIGRGFNRLVYTPMFLRSMKPKAMRKLAQHPGLFDADALMGARDLYEFDNIFTAPLHGFSGTEDYWAKASAKPHLAKVAVPALLVNALNDPFVPSASLPQPGNVSRHIELWQPRQGGHVGFPAGLPPGHVHAMPKAVGTWLLQHL